jgi:hypothetical protein
MLSGEATNTKFNKTDSHDITEILLKVALNSINKTNQFHSVGIGLSMFVQCKADTKFCGLIEQNPQKLAFNE